MRTISFTLFACLAIVLNASASPELLVETTITQNHTEGGPDVLKGPNIKVKSGEPAVVVVGQLEYTVTPTLKEDGEVEVWTVLSKPEGDQRGQIAGSLKTTQLGQTYEFKIGQFAFASKITVAK